jgi:hypothetical protein
MNRQKLQLGPFNPALGYYSNERNEGARNNALRNKTIIGPALETVTLDHYIADEAIILAESVSTSDPAEMNRLLVEAALTRYYNDVVPVLANEMGRVTSSNLTSQIMDYKVSRLPESDPRVRVHMDGKIGNFDKPYFFWPAQVKSILESPEAACVREAYVSGVVKEAKNILNISDEYN